MIRAFPLKRLLNRTMWSRDINLEVQHGGSLENPAPFSVQSDCQKHGVPGIFKIRAYGKMQGWRHPLRCS